MPPEPVTTNIWLEQQLQRALARLEALTQQVEQLRDALRSEQAESNRLQQEVALLTGRTGRHEATLDQVRGLQQQLGALEQRLEAESVLRRDRAGSTDREQRRESEAQQSVETTVTRIDAEVQRVTDRLAALDERLRQVAGDVAQGGVEEGAIEARFDTLERRVESVIASGHRDDADRSAAESSIPELRSALAAIEARTRALHEEQQRFEEELGRLAPAAEVQTTLAAAVEQVRSLRERMEVRLLALEAQLEDSDHAGTRTADERALLQRRIAMQDERLRALDATVEAQRDTLIEHVRRSTAASEEAGKRQMQEIDRQTRAGRELVRKLVERADENAQEQPL